MTEGGGFVPVDLHQAVDQDNRLVTITAVKRENSAPLRVWVLSFEDYLRFGEEVKNQPGVEPVSALKAVAGPGEATTEMIGCIHESAPNRMCWSCSQKMLGLEPGTPDYRPWT